MLFFPFGHVGQSCRQMDWCVCAQIVRKIPLWLFLVERMEGRSRMGYFGKNRCNVVMYISCMLWQTVFSLVRRNCFEHATSQASAKLELATANTARAGSSLRRCLLSWLKCLEGEDQIPFSWSCSSLPRWPEREASRYWFISPKHGGIWGYPVGLRAIIVHT